jgi:hypothetical protein
VKEAHFGTAPNLRMTSPLTFDKPSPLGEGHVGTAFVCFDLASDDAGHGNRT